MAESLFNDTKESFDNLASTVTGDWSTGWGIQVNHSSYSDEFNNNLSGIVSSGLEYGNNLYSTGQAIVSIGDGSTYVELADAAGSAALNYLNQKIERIKTAWTTTTSVSVGALLGEVAPYCLTPETALSKLSTRVSSLLGNMLGVNGNSWEDLGYSLANDLSDSLLSDPAVTSAVSNLGIVKTVASTFNTITSAVNVVKNIYNTIEPLFPYLEIASNLALVLFSGGTSGVEAANKTTMTVESEVQKLMSLLTASLRKALFNINLKVPVALVGALETLSVREAMLGYGTEADSWLRAIFDESFYQETLNSLTWQKSISEALNSVINWSSSDASDIIESMLGESDQTVLGNNMRDRFLSTLTKDFMNNALAEARKEAYIPIPGSISWITSDDFGSMQDSILGTFETQKVFSTELDRVLDDSSDSNPITDEESIRAVSKTIYECIA